MTAAERLADVARTDGSYRACADTGEIHGVARQARTCNQHGESERSVPARVMSPTMRNGRLSVRISLGGRPRTISVASAVLESFVGERPRGHIVIHLNGDMADCRLANLAWGPRCGQSRGAA
jgi:hypothetical protein